MNYDQKDVILVMKRPEDGYKEDIVQHLNEHVRIIYRQGTFPCSAAEYIDVQYLLKNFGFRKAYCKLHIQYRPLMKLAVNMLYPFRRIIKKFSKNKLIYQVWCTMRQEEIHRTFR